MKKLFPLFIIVSILLSACGAVEQSVTSTEEATTGQGTLEAAPSEEPSVEATTKLDVNIDALRGQEVRVWTPWYGVEQSLFESFVNEFNSSNPYGIKVSAESQSNFTNVYEITTAALPTENKPDLVIALPEHAQGWYQDQVSIDLTDYAEDPVYGLDESDIPYAIWNQDIAGTARV
ncbi:MAG TPA: hypothetical protein PKJ84_04560, partial [Anaerolineales bacterium]|nr:hypothetical protein [Anaerolineales bacterium]